jgi:methylthioribose-1-phosphate isomerase
MLMLRNPDAAKSLAGVLAEKKCRNGRMKGVHGKVLIKEGMNVLTHCNAGWLGFVDHGSALSPYMQPIGKACASGFYAE